jgi:hypothetical protein
VPYIVRIFDPNRTTAFALAVAIARQILSPLTAIEAQEELEESKGKLLEVLDKLELHRRMPSPSPSLRKKGTLSRALLRSPPPPKIPLGEFTVLHRHQRSRPHRRRLTVAPGLPHRSSSHGAAARCVVPPLSPAGAVVSRPCLDRRSRLEREILHHIFNLSCRPENRRLSFNDSPWTRALAAVDLVYGPCTYSTDFSIEK